MEENGGEERRDGQVTASPEGREERVRKYWWHQNKKSQRKTKELKSERTKR